MKKIAFVRLRYLPPSETFIYEELKNIRGFKPIVFARKINNLKRFPYKRIKRLPRTPKKIYRVLKRNRIRLIHARFGNAGVTVMRAKQRLRIPMLVSFHGFDLPVKRQKRKRYHRRLPVLFRIGDKFTVPSRHMKRKLIRWGCPSHKIKIMYSGIDLNKFTYSPRDLSNKNMTIIAVGRLHRKKGFRYLIKAFRRVRKRYPSSRLIIVGEGRERKRLKRLIASLRLKKHVKLKGLVAHRHLAKLLKKADIFCLPSTTTGEGNQEGIPNAMKEAMATGLPVVSTRHGGIPELVSHGREGLLVREKDVRGLAKKLIKLMKDPALRREMGRKGRDKVERRFNSKKQVNRLESIYRKLIRKGRR